ncbi:MAG: hypothetical protein ACFFCP_01585 [Promethearchaeota archaeon]
MNPLVSFIALALFLGGTLILLASHPRLGFSTVGMKMRRAVPTKLTLLDFIHSKPSRLERNQLYLFSEETVRSLGYRFIGRFDTAVLHWEDAPILDLIIEHKFPIRHLPRQNRMEDIFQAGLYALALFESGVSCSSTKLVTIYCLQDDAKRCFERGSVAECWKCGKSRIHIKRFNPRSIIRTLKKMDEVWYHGRKPKPSPDPEKCRICPYSMDRCNYSVV